MAGYIGTKAVLLSTTAATVTGDAEIAGGLTVDTNTLFVDSTNNRVGIGIASPAYPLDVYGHNAIRGANAQFWFNSDNTNFSGIYNAGSTGAGNGNLVVETNGTERMRIDASGNVLIGGGPTVYAKHTLTNNSGHSRAVDMLSGASGYFDRFLFNGVDNGSITLIGGGVLFNTTSDYRRKENVVPVSGASDLIAQIPVYTFNYIDHADRTLTGFLAHEVQEIVPEAVTGTKDGMREETYEVTPAVYDDEGNLVSEAVMGTREVPDYQGIDQSKLVPLLTAALQEALTEIAALKDRVAALEAN